jgi:hypothetical protein
MIDGRASKQQATSFRKYYQLSKKAEPLTGLCLFRGIGCIGRVHPERGSCETGTGKSETQRIEVISAVDRMRYAIY